jgi:N6-adenosine-specific RNA methylase IME4
MIKLVTGAGNKAIFDKRPIKLPGFVMRHNYAEPIGKPSLDEWTNAYELSCAWSESSLYWIGDLVSYADNRADWREKLDQAKSITRLAEQTLHNVASVCRRVAVSERNVAPSYSHAALVAKLSAPDQRRWLRKATTEGWGIRELDQELKASQKRGVIKGSAELSGMFRTWLVDFPWTYRQGQPSKVSAQSHYPGLTVDQGIKMSAAVKAHTTKKAVMFFWVTAPMLYYASDGLAPDPYRIIKAWGFEPKTGGVWDKVSHTFGHYFSIRHEHLIVCTRGDCTPDRPTPMIDSVFTERKSDVHSEKPEAVAKAVERLYDGPYVELFARKQRRGWTCYGNQIGAPLVEAQAG